MEVSHDLHNRILDKFSQLSQIGKNGLIAFWKAAASINFHISGNSVATWTSCMEGDTYLKHEFGLPYNLWHRYPEKTTSVPELIAHVSKWLGLYHVQFTGYESHYFTIYLDEVDVTVANSYGGIRDLTIFQMDREVWIEYLEKAMLGDLDAYAFIFNVPREKLAIPQVGFESVEYRHHANPVFLLYDNPDVDLDYYWKYVRDPLMDLTDQELVEEGFNLDDIDNIRQEEEEVEELGVGMVCKPRPLTRKNK